MLNDSLGKVYDAFKDEETYLKLYLGIYIIYLFISSVSGSYDSSLFEI